MTCRTDREELSAYLDGELEPGRRAAVEEHLAGCGECARVVEEWRRIGGLLAALPRESAPASVRAGVRAAIARPVRRPLPRVPLWVGAAAATLLVAVGVVWLFDPFGGRHRDGNPPVDAVEETRTDAPNRLPAQQLGALEEELRAQAAGAPGEFAEAPNQGFAGRTEERRASGTNTLETPTVVEVAPEAPVESASLEELLLACYETVRHEHTYRLDLQERAVRGRAGTFRRINRGFEPGVLTLTFGSEEEFDQFARRLREEYGIELAEVEQVGAPQARSLGRLEAEPATDAAADDPQALQRGRTVAPRIYGVVPHEEFDEEREAPVSWPLVVRVEIRPGPPRAEGERP